MKLSILGTRGIPAAHGGFETFAERLALFLVEKGWQVVVYCQEEGNGPTRTSQWRGVDLVHIPVPGNGALSTIRFDLKTVLHAVRQQGLFLTLGYNTAIFNVLQRFYGQTNLINMDGIEWKRQKWGALPRAWFWTNERIGCMTGNHLIADHPEILTHLATRARRDKITMIPYGADQVNEADAALLAPYGLTSGGFSVIIARPEPENSFLQMVRAFSAKRRDHKLVVLGKFDVAHNAYHRDVQQAASDEVLFPGAIYDADIVKALRFHSRLYLHGHQVGGTNPSLVEALGAGCAVLAHDNAYNRWVAGAGAAYFADESSCAQQLDRLLQGQEPLQQMKDASLARYHEQFTWDRVLQDYETLLARFHPQTGASR